MTENSLVRARMDEATLRRVATEKALPFQPLLPNAETVEAMKAARRGGVVTAGKPDCLLASLNADH